MHGYIMVLGVPGDAITLDKAELLLGGFGVAFRLDDTSRFGSYIPLELRPPEVFSEPETALTFLLEIWILGCATFALLVDRADGRVHGAAGRDGRAHAGGVVERMGGGPAEVKRVQGPRRDKETWTLDEDEHACIGN
ncbi:hypothetical protein E4U61_004849 [Claviceps capensis]|nr:hypothetical protein E4U61_004849 [Claviceps capensis]